MLGSEKDRKEKEHHIRVTHTFECIVCALKHSNKEILKFMSVHYVVTDTRD